MINALASDTTPVPHVPRETGRQRWFWTTREDAILREHYPAGGPAPCQALLPNRSVQAIYTRARTLNLRDTRSMDQRVRFRDYRKQPKYRPSADLDEQIRAVYNSEAFGKGAIKPLADRWGVPGWWIKKRAVEIGCARPIKEPPWSDAELELLERHAWKRLPVIARLFRAAGYRRTETAIAVQRKRQECSTRDPHHYTANQLAKLLGVDLKVVTRWCGMGWLPAARRGTERTELQGGDHWWIARKDLRQFVLEHVERVELRKITDSRWFVDLIAGRSPT